MNSPFVSSEWGTVNGKRETSAPSTMHHSPFLHKETEVFL